MAIDTNITTSKLQLRYNYGVDDKGNPIIKSKTYSNMKKDATDEVVYEVATAIGALQANTLEEVHKVQDMVLIQVV